MNWDNQLSSILSVADGSVAKMRVSTFKYFYLYVLIHTEAGFFSASLWTVLLWSQNKVHITQRSSIADNKKKKKKRLGVDIYINKGAY